MVRKRGDTCKRYFDAQVRIWPRAVNVDNKCAFHEQWSLPRGFPYIYKPFVGLGPWAFMLGLPSR